ncbi:MAG: hypothetical protein R3C11_19430 [Planctomycetaceae bacterium]
MSFLFSDALTSAPYRIYRQKKNPEEQLTYAGSLFIHQMFVTGLVMLILVGIYLASLSSLLLGEYPETMSLFGLVPFILMRNFCDGSRLLILQFEIAILIDHSCYGFAADYTLHISLLANVDCADCLSGDWVFLFDFCNSLVLN